MRYLGWSQFTTIVIGLALSFALPACSRSTKVSKYFGSVTPPAGNVLTYVSGAEPQGMDPQTLTGQPESRIAVALFDGLVEYEEVNMKPRPSLATSWEINADGTVWTFHLRHDARWSDGAPLNAHDMVYSWRRAVDPKTAALYASLLGIVRNADAVIQNGSFLRDQQSGKYATVKDLERAGTDSEIRFTGDAPFYAVDMVLDNAQVHAPYPSAPNSAIHDSAYEKLFTVPTDKQRLDALLHGDPAKDQPANTAVARFIAGKQLVPIAPQNLGVEAVDDYTFQVTLESPSAYFIKLLYHQFFRPVPRQAIEKWGAPLWTKPEHMVCSGAFTLQEWSPYQRIVVVRNPMFWDNANTKLDKIIFPSIEQLTTAMNMYKAGEVDCTLSNEVPPNWRKELKETKLDYRQGPYLQIEAIALKSSLPALSDVRVRKALSLAINRQQVADQAPGRLPTNSFVPLMDGYVNASGTLYDPVEARRLLAEAGYPGGKGFPRLEYLYNSAESNKQNGEFYQQFWKHELGIDVELVNVEWGVYLDRTRARKLDFNGTVRMAWIGDFVDPYSFLELAASDSANNRTAWKDAKYDRMLLDANAETDATSRMRQLHDAEQYMIDHYVYIPVYIGPSSFMCKPYVKNLVPNLLDQHDWRNVYIDHSAVTE